MTSKPTSTTQRKLGVEFAFKTKYINPLPDLPFEPKLLEYPFQKDKDYKWSNNSLFEKKTYELCGDKEESTISLHQAHLDNIEKNLRSLKGEDVKEIKPEPLSEFETFLLSKPLDAVSQRKERARHRPIVSWLRRTEYISSELSKTVTTKSEGVESRIGMSVMNDEALKEHAEATRDGQIKIIEKSFQFVNDLEKIQALQHPTNKSLKVMEVFPVYPDWENWSNEYIQASFDSHPLRNELKLTEPTEDEKIQLEEALLKPTVDPTYADKKFLSYYVPNEQALGTIVSKRKLREQFGEDVQEVEGQQYEYNYVRDFDYETKVENETKRVFFMLRPRLGAFYNYLNTKLTMKRRRARSKLHGRRNEILKPSRVIVKRRKFNAEEKMHRNKRLSEVAPLEQLEDESSDEDERDIETSIDAQE